MEFVILKSFTNYIDAHILLGRMQEEGIQCWLKDEHTTTLNAALTIATGGIQLMVNDSQMQRANDLLNEFDREGKKVFVCPQCGSGNVEYINTMRKPVNWLSAAVTFFLGDVALMPEQRYHCFNCSNEFEIIEKKEDN